MSNHSKSVKEIKYFVDLIVRHLREKQELSFIENNQKSNLFKKMIQY